MMASFQKTTLLWKMDMPVGGMPSKFIEPLSRSCMSTFTAGAPGNDHDHPLRSNSGPSLTSYSPTREKDLHHKEHSVPASFVKIIAELRKAERSSSASQPFSLKDLVASCPISMNQHRQRTGHPTSLGTAKGAHGHSKKIILPGVLLTMCNDRVLGKLLQSNRSKPFLGVNSKLTRIQNHMAGGFP